MSSQARREADLILGEARLEAQRGFSLSTTNTAISCKRWFTSKDNDSSLSPAFVRCSMLRLASWTN